MGRRLPHVQRCVGRLVRPSRRHAEKTGRTTAKTSPRSAASAPATRRSSAPIVRRRARRRRRSAPTHARRRPRSVPTHGQRRRRRRNVPRHAPPRRTPPRRASGYRPRRAAKASVRTALPPNAAAPSLMRSPDIRAANRSALPVRGAPAAAAARAAAVAAAAAAGDEDQRHDDDQHFPEQVQRDRGAHGGVCGDGDAHRLSTGHRTARTVRPSPHRRSRRSSSRRR